ncbi:GNAT family N-acetyltransferase [Microbispora catharanthi]|uniref:GNAT family N-acetyltransferase n=1 Tax=Microbispora catharanthi TaxID=1712871 RepID=A0A5N6BIX9_9ACTN|nr:GNAT family N-acetyltransferase [Microbispora catharanthi]KAB8180375.1 GNAT family N-acetyltransferase [Microbispora catharanthi]
MSDRHLLDNPVWASLTGPHGRFAERRGSALRYPDDVSPFFALPDDPGPPEWSDLAALAGPGTTVPVTGEATAAPDGWEVVAHGAGVQLVGDDVVPARDDEAVRLRAADVPEMLDLVARTQPGPFRPRTIEMGAYLGIRRGGALVAMAGERLHPPGWTEISAVCTDPAFRRQGLASRLVLTVAAGIRARGETPFLHAAASNTTAIRVYEALGFRLRRRTTFATIRVPADVPVA